MVQLFLSEPSWSEEGDDESIERKISFLNDLESPVWSLMSSGGRSEARLWLCSTLSEMSSISPRHQRELFLSLLRSKPLKRGFAAQLLQMIFEKQPRKAGAVIAKKSYLLEDFFRGNTRRILLWFSNFSGSSDLEHRKGAKALSQFAFVNRDICWEELEWKGKHGQSPAMVATKPHYFLDLDVQQTVENFLEYVPEFWSSIEFSASLKDGEILSIDKNFFVDLFVDFMYKDDVKEVWELINDFLMEESFSSLCHHLLIILEEKDFCVFLDLICKFLDPKMKSLGSDNASYWIEFIISKCSARGSVDQLLLLNALISQGRQLLRLAHEEEHQEEKEKIKDISLHIFASLSRSDSLALILKLCSKKKTIESIILLGLLSWAIHFRLSEECQSSESWESLFITNHINFRKSSKYGLLHHDGFSEESGSDLDERASVRGKHKKKAKRRKKKRRNFAHDDVSENELLDFKVSSDGRGLQFQAVNWLLSIDGYSTAWNSVDLPEHLSKHCFSQWMNWITVNW